MMSYITTAASFSICTVLVYACYTDLFYRKILNKSVILVLILSLCKGFAQGEISVIAPVVFLIAGYFFSAVGCIGAGDIKLVFALLIGIPHSSIFHFFILMCVFGIPVALLSLLVSKVALKHKFKTVPFGIAITVGYITAFSWG